MHIQKIRDNCKKKVNQLHSVIINRDINLSARRLLLLSVVRPSLEYVSEIWDCNKSQTRALESSILGGAKKIARHFKFALSRVFLEKHPR